MCVWRVLMLVCGITVFFEVGIIATLIVYEVY